MPAPTKKNNIWKYDIATGKNTQLTHFTNFDITFPGNSSSAIIFEAGGELYLYNLALSSTSKLSIKLISDQKELLTQQKKVDKYIQGATISPDGNRVVVQARGELFNLPATEGYISNLTASSGSAERYPAWSPDGKSLAYWSDKTGEYQLVIVDMTGEAPPRTVTNFTSGFRYSIFWSPDSKKIAFIDQAMNISCLDVVTGVITKIDNGRSLFEYSLRHFKVSWSPDSKWIAYSRTTDNNQSAIFVYNVESNQVAQLTFGYYDDSNPTFSTDGKQLFYTTERSFVPVYSSLDNTFAYPNATKIAVGTLNSSVESLLSPKNDQVNPDKKDDDEEEDEDNKSVKSKKSKKSKSDKKEDKKDDIEPVTIESNGFENRVELLDIEPGVIGRLSTVDGKLLFVRFPNSGSTKDSSPSLNYYDFKEREVKTIIPDVAEYTVAANGEKILVAQQQKLAVIDVDSGQKIDKTVPIQKMMMEVVPREEWNQIFNDAWRIERDFFYDPEMHGVDWNLMKTRYSQFINQANSRNDVNIIIGDLIAELNASHTYNGGGDKELASQMNVGYLGANISLENRRFRIKKIINGAPWDAEVRSPLTKPGVNIHAGDYILAVNGQNIDTNKPIYAAFQGLGDATAQLTVNNIPSYDNARKVVIRLLRSETRLRHLAWIESNRKWVDKATNGQIGYIYVRSTGVDGQNELFRQFNGQRDKKGLIIDERFNSGGQIPDRFIELLDRKPLAFWATRDGDTFQAPQSANFGPKVMLINGFSGSGGDAFPDYFKKRGIGPVIGTKTWGGLIGITGAPTLIDNGRVTVPTFRMYDPDGQWFKEGYGVDPDIEVIQDFQKLANGQDAQLEAGVKEVLRLLNSGKEFKIPARPAYEKRD